MYLELKMQQVSYLDVKNEEANYRLKFRGYKIKNAVLVMY